MPKNWRLPRETASLESHAIPSEARDFGDELYLSLVGNEFASLVALLHGCYLCEEG